MFSRIRKFFSTKRQLHQTINYLLQQVSDLSAEMGQREAREIQVLNEHASQKETIEELKKDRESLKQLASERLSTLRGYEIDIKKFREERCQKAYLIKELEKDNHHLIKERADLKTRLLHIKDLAKKALE